MLWIYWSQRIRERILKSLGTSIIIQSNVPPLPESKFELGHVLTSNAIQFQTTQLETIFLSFLYSSKLASLEKRSFCIIHECVGLFVVLAFVTSCTLCEFIKGLLDCKLHWYPKGFLNYFGLLINFVLPNRGFNMVLLLYLSFF